MGVFTRDEVVQLSANLRAQGKQVGFTSGVFDILHPGHVQYLAEAKALCQYLIVGINSDSSVRGNKGDLRPIVPAQDRALVVAALESVDAVFIFDEPNNNQNIELLQPHLYLKAGDYDKAKLSSSSLVEAYGGRVEILPFKPGYSSSKIIEKVLGYASTSITIPKTERRPAVFLDRDGTLIEHVEYLHEPEKLKLFPDTVQSLKQLREAGFRLFLVTNQPGIGLGYFSKEDFFVVNRELLKACSAQGVIFDRIYFCPHSPADRCSCRKPGIELFNRAAKDFELDKAASFMIGDTSFDIEAAKNFGIRSALIHRETKQPAMPMAVPPSYEAKTLAAAVDWILKSSVSPNPKK